VILVTQDSTLGLNQQVAAGDCMPAGHTAGLVTVIDESVTADERRAFARRHLGEEGGDRYVASSVEATGRMIRIRMWLSEDQS
jgi:hypothetical protein